MKKGYEKIVKAIEVTKKYDTGEIELLSGLFSYLNNFDADLDDEGFGTGVSAKGLWKLLNPLTKNLTNQTFEKWWNSVSNTARLKENIDFERKEKTEIQAKFPTSQKGEVGIRPVKKVDYILTLRAGEYCAVLTKGDSGDLYRRFIFDIKDEFLRLVFRYGKSIETRSDFTKSIGDLEFMKKLKSENKKKELGSIYGEMTNIIYIELFGVKATEFKELNNIDRKYFAKDFFTKDGLFDLEKLENKLSGIILFSEPKNRNELKEIIKKFLNKSVKINIIE